VRKAADDFVCSTHTTVPRYDFNCSRTTILPVGSSGSLSVGLAVLKSVACGTTSGRRRDLVPTVWIELLCPP
jgi:hypothetical protein